MGNVNSIELRIIDIIFEVLTLPVVEKVKQIIDIIEDNKLQNEKHPIRVSTIADILNLAMVTSYIEGMVESEVRFRLKEEWVEDLSYLVKESIPDVMFELLKEEYAKVGIFVFRDKENDLYIQLRNT